MKVKAPREKNFRRAKVKPGRPKRSRKRWIGRTLRRITAVLLFAYASYRAVNLVVRASPLQVEHIVVSGNVRLSSGEVQALTRGLQGRSILTADLEASRRRLLDSPWIADAALRRVLPSTIEVQISERQPIGISRLGSRLYLIDRSGTVIDEFGPRYQDFDLPIIDGLVRAPRKGSPAIDEGRAELAARVIDDMARRRDVARLVSQIDVADERDVVLLLDSDAAQLHVGDEKFLERVRSYLEVAGTIHERFAEIDYVDLRFDDRVYVKPRGSGRTVDAGSAPTSGKSF
jgi:cell division septal protein FtsQ